MKLLLKILKYLILFIGILCLGLYVSGNKHIFRGVYLIVKNDSYGPVIYEYLDSSNDTIPPSNRPITWNTHDMYNKLYLHSLVRDTLEKLQTTALLFIKKDSIFYEEYWGEYDEAFQTNSFSMAKSFVSLLVGAALDDGAIESLDQKVCDFIPRYCDGLAGQLTIKHLLTMSAGINFDESYTNPFGYPAKANYGDNIRELVTEYNVVEKPGLVQDYQSGTTQILSFLIEEAVGKTISEYFYEKIWNPIGAENKAYWTLDRKGGDEKAFCCVNAVARDFAKIGKLVLDTGKVDGNQILPKQYILESIQVADLVDDEGKPIDHYGYSWWILNYKGNKVVYARGYKGQYIMCLPEKDLIAVRLGHHRSKQRKHNNPIEIYAILDGLLEMENQLK